MPKQISKSDEKKIKQLIAVRGGGRAGQMSIARELGQTTNLVYNWIAGINGWTKANRAAVLAMHKRDCALWDAANQSKPDPVPAIPIEAKKVEHDDNCHCDLCKGERLAAKLDRQKALLDARNGDDARVERWLIDQSTDRRPTDVPVVEAMVNLAAQYPDALRLVFEGATLKAVELC